MQQQSPITSVKTEAGIFHGRKKENTVKFAAIRYAASERFGKPVPYKYMHQHPVRNYSPVCPQDKVPFLDFMIGESDKSIFEVEESCQYLSITTPSHCNALSSLPVMVWIHGGSYVLGSGDVPSSDPAAIVHENGVIVVSVNYRLGLFGFLGNSEERPANLGLFDILEALKWIKAHIRNFGGNPDHITLFGQSAGGDAIAHLMLVEGTEKLFQRVIIQSAPLHFAKNRANLIKNFVKKTTTISKENTIDEIIAMQDFFPSIIRNGLKAMMPFGTQYGYDPLPDEDSAAKIWAGKAHFFEVLIGSNERETAFYIPAFRYSRKFQKSRIARQHINSRIVRYTSERIYGAPARRFAERHHNGGGNAAIFRIKFGSAENGLGAAHSIDLALLFPNYKIWKNGYLTKGISEEKLMQEGKKVRKIWADFAKQGLSSIPDQEIPNLLSLRKL